MTSIPAPSQGPEAGRNGSPSPKPGASASTPAKARTRTSRTATVWASVIVALLALILLIIFILQNQQPARVLFLGLDGTVALGVALLIAAVGGGVLVAAAGVARIMHLRSSARRVRKATATPQTGVDH